MKGYSCRATTKLIFTIALAVGSTTLSASSESSAEQKIQYANSATNTIDQGLSEGERIQARHWKLTDKEWTRYKEIMNGRRGIWSPGLDPVTALGVHAETEQERTRYAELWVQLEYERTDKELAFERARLEAAKRLYPDQPAINNQQFIDNFKDRRAAIEQRQMVLFVGLDCEVCEDLVPRLYKTLGAGGKLDIYISNANDQQIREWAADHDIPPELVQQRVITLNHARFSDMISLGVYGDDPKLFRMDAAGNAEEISI